MKKFDTVIDRYGTYCDKWDYLERYYGEQGMLGLWVADMDFAVAEPIQKAIAERVQHPIYGYTEIDENLNFYDPMIAWYAKKQNYTIEKEWIQYAPGVIPAIAFAMQAFTKEGDKVIIQEPVYHPFKKTILDNNRIPLINELIYDGTTYHMDLESLEAQIDEKTTMMILCSPHNPVGRVWTKEELTAVGELCIRHHILLIVDEIHSDIVLPPHHHTVFATISEEFADMCILCNAPTKTFNIAGLNGSNIIIKNPELRKIYAEHVAKFHLSGPTCITMAAFSAAYAQGESWHNEMMMYLQENVKLVADTFAEKLPTVKVVPTEGSYMMWLDFNGTGLDMDEINRRLISEAKVALNDGYMFGKSGAGFQRMNVACPKSVLQEALDRIIAAFA